MAVNNILQYIQYNTEILIAWQYNMEYTYIVTIQYKVFYIGNILFLLFVLPVPQKARLHLFVDISPAGRVGKTREPYAGTGLKMETLTNLLLSVKMLVAKSKPSAYVSTTAHVPSNATAE